MSTTVTRASTPVRTKRRRWVWRFLGAVLVLVAVIGSGIIYVAYKNARELRAALKEADALDPEWHTAQLEARRAVVPDNQNSALVLDKAWHLLPRDWPFWDLVPTGAASAEIKDLLQVFWEPDPPVELREHQAEILRKEMGRVANALTEARKVIDMPHGRYPIAYRQGYDPYNAQFESTQRARTMIRLLKYDALLQAQEKRTDDALITCCGMLNVDRSIGDEPVPLATMVRLSVRLGALLSIERTLALGEASEPALARLQHELEKEAVEPILLIYMRGERAMVDGLFEAVERGDAPYREIEGFITSIPPAKGSLADLNFRLQTGPLKHNRAALLRFNTEMVQIAKLPVERQGEAFAAQTTKVAQLPWLGRQHIFVNFKPAEAYRRDQAYMRSAIVLLAAERYRLAHGHWPKTLEKLVPQFLTEIPIDPFDAKPLRLHRTDTGLVVYSVGDDGVDNGGLKLNLSTPGSDRGFRLWDVKLRRQPAKPAHVDH